MVFFILDAATLNAKGTYQSDNYDIFLASIFDTDVSKVTVSARNAAAAEDFVYCETNGWVGIVKSVDNADDNADACTLTCKSINFLFDQDTAYTYYTASQVAVYEAYAAQLINTVIVSPGDPMFAHSFMQTTYTTGTSSSPNNILWPVTDAKGVYNLKTYLENLRSYQGIFIDFSLPRISGANALLATINKKTPTARNVDFSDSSYKLTSETYSRSGISRVTTYCAAATGDTTREWFLKKDGTIVGSTIAAMPTQTLRMPGQWITVAIDSNNNSQDTAVKQFQNNKFSHLIEFNTKKVLNFFDTVTVGIRGKSFSSYITSVEIKDNTGRRYYKSGELRATFLSKYGG